MLKKLRDIWLVISVIAVFAAMLIGAIALINSGDWVRGMLLLWLLFGVIGFLAGHYADTL